MTGPGDPGGGTPPEVTRPQLQLPTYDYARKICIKATSDSIKLTDYNPFAIGKYLEYIVGSNGPAVKGKTIVSQSNVQNEIRWNYRTRTDIIVTTIDSKQTNKLLKAKKFGDLDITVTVPIFMNTVRGVANMVGFNRMSEEDIVEHLKTTGVIVARHFRRKQGDIYI